ncbi:LOW QUALITY PROTEIN: hypothetical protein V1477_004494 [Vespula maculifrons]|uniref:Ribosomal protein S3 n=1 Tax=Vespula maculifrons TaxID=7453 RepID=A0ABD2CLZ5_VESMC
MAPGSLERARRALTEVNRNVVVGKGSSRPLRAYFFRPDRTNRSRVITEPSYNGLKGTKEKKYFSLTIFFSETIASRRTGPGSLERACRSLYAHIFFVQIGPENRTGVIGKGSSLPLRPYFFRPDWTSRSRVITHPGEPDWGRWKGLVTPTTPIFFSSRSDQREPSYNGLKGKKEKTFFFNNFFLRNYSTQEYRTGVTGKGSSRRVGPYFFRPDRTNRSRVITYLGEPDLGHWKGLVAPSTPIFFTSRSDQRTGPVSLERARRSLYAHIFFVLIGPIGADTQENQTWVMGKGSLRPLRPYFFRPDRTNRSRVITVTKEKKHFSLTIFFSETIAPTRTGSVSLERARRDLYAHIFFVQIGPIGAELLRTQEYRTGVAGKGSSLPIRPYFFRPDQTNRSRVITHPGEPDQGSWKVLVAPCAPIFFSSRSNQ